MESIYVACKCGSARPYKAITVAAAIEKARAAGWIVSGSDPDEPQDTCPQCAAEDDEED
jgi:hypothetical protein